MSNKSIINNFIIASGLLATGMIFVLCANSESKKQNGFLPLRVAHAAGGLQGQTYTNSYEALNYNYKRGFRYFEIDFSFTRDGELVCLHDWEGVSSRGKLTLQELLAFENSYSDVHMCTLDGLASWMKMYPDTIIITDVKDDQEKALLMIKETIDNATERVIPQIYYPQEQRLVKQLGFKSFILTLYRSAISDVELLQHIESHYAQEIFAITMPKKRAKRGLARQLKRRNIPTYVHTVNNSIEVWWLKRWCGVTEIYTDFLGPA